MLCLHISYLQIAITKFSVSIINRLCSFFICFLVLLGVHLEYHLSFLYSDSMLLDQDLCPQFYKKQWRLGKAQLNITLFPFIFNEWYKVPCFYWCTFQCKIFMLSPFTLRSFDRFPINFWFSWKAYTPWRARLISS